MSCPWTASAFARRSREDRPGTGQQHAVASRHTADGGSAPPRAETGVMVGSLVVSGPGRFGRKLVGASNAPAPAGAFGARFAAWLTAMCVSPVVGVLFISACPVPAAAQPLLLSAAGGVLARAAPVSMRAAYHGLPRGRLLLSGPAAATTVAAAITLVAGHVVG